MNLRCDPPDSSPPLSSICLLVSRCPVTVGSEVPMRVLLHLPLCAAISQGAALFVSLGKR